MMRRIIVGLALVLAAAGGWAGYLFFVAVPEVVAARPVRGPAVKAVYATGNVEATYWAKVTPLVQGRIEEICACEGRAVKRGDILASLDLADQGDKRPDQLSGGQRQRVAIACALANDPSIVLADEPTGNLDTRNARAVFEIFSDLARRQGRTVIAVTHDPGLAAMTGRQLRIVDGRITGDETLEAVAAPA